MNTFKYILIFILIQIVSLILTIIGIPVIAGLALYGARWPKWAWIWNNDEDGVYGPQGPFTRWQMFYWTALRNPVANLKHVPGVSGVGRPLYYRTWTMGSNIYSIPRTCYFKAGWMSNGYPCLSGGSGRGY